MFSGKNESLQVLANGQKDMDVDGSCKCPICEKPFASRYYLKKHVILHTNELPYKCDECGKLFRWQASLKNHRMMEHDGPKPQVCKECGQGFKSLHSLKKHCLIDHGSAKIFTCSFCPKYFLSSYAQARHEVIHQKK
jgi:KRAB domain-containing zinc finger protein